MDTLLQLPENLSLYGFFKKNLPDEKINICALSQIRKFIKTNFIKQKSLNNRCDSYGLKHLVEDKTGRYVANGELIAAMILEGYLHSREEEQSPNCLFNISQTSINKAKKLKSKYN